MRVCHGLGQRLSLLKLCSEFLLILLPRVPAAGTQPGFSKLLPRWQEGSVKGACEQLSASPRPSGSEASAPPSPMEQNHPNLTGLILLFLLFAAGWQDFAG